MCVCVCVRVCVCVCVLLIIACLFKIIFLNRLRIYIERSYDVVQIDKIML